MFTRSICWVGPASSLTWVGFRGAGAFRRMLSNESLLFALNSGCLNSQAYECQEYAIADVHVGPLTPDPYGECPLSSLLCRTLWKSYLLSCRTKLAKLLCLKCLGRIDLVNLSFCMMYQTGRSQPAGLGKIAPRERQSFHHHRPIEPLASTRDLPAFL